MVSEGTVVEAEEVIKIIFMASVKAMGAPFLKRKTNLGINPNNET